MCLGVLVDHKCSRHIIFLRSIPVASIPIQSNPFRTRDDYHPLAAQSTCQEILCTCTPYGRVPSINIPRGAEGDLNQQLEGHGHLVTRYGVPRLRYLQYRVQSRVLCTHSSTTVRKTLFFLSDYSVPFSTMYSMCSHYSVLYILYSEGARQVREREEREERRGRMEGSRGGRVCVCFL